MNSTTGRGGPRSGAGRPRGSGRYGDATRPLRVPVGLTPLVKAWLAGLHRPILHGADVWAIGRALSAHGLAAVRHAGAGRLSLAGR